MQKVIEAMWLLHIFSSNFISSHHLI